MPKRKHNYKETNIIYCGDSKDILKKIPDNSIDLIYLDPPFFSHKHYEGFWDDKTQKKLKTQFSDEKWNKLKKSIKPNIMKIYEHIGERWKGGHKGIYVYIAYMRERLEQCWRVLKPTGSIYLHCDWHAGHYLKVMMDEIFYYDKFRNEIIWHYKSFHGQVKNYFPRKHDTVFLYTKSKKWTFNRQFSKDNITTIDYKRWKKYLVDGYKILGKNMPMQDTRFVRFYKRWVKEHGRKPKPNDVVYEVIGQSFDTVWDIKPVDPKSSERLGYPTQKPEALIERIIEASSKKGSLILDPFCGGGTTLVVAKRLKRKYIGVDISRTACRVARDRLRGGVKIFGDETLKEVIKMNPHDVAELIIVDRWDGTINPKKSGDYGIDGWVENRTIPVQVKRWKHKVGRPEIDKFKTAIERDNKQKGFIVAERFSKDSYAEVARIKAKHGIDIELVEFKIIFKTHNKSHSHNHGKEYINHPLMMIF